jgi:hypothetical protein
MITFIAGSFKAYVFAKSDANTLTNITFAILI